MGKATPHIVTLLLTLLLSALLIYSAVVAYRRYRRLSPVSQAGLLKVLSAHVLTTLAFGALTPQLPSHWASVVAILAVHSSGLVTYLGYEQILNQRATPWRRFWRLVSTVLLLAVALSGVSFLSYEPIGAHLEQRQVTFIWADYLANGGASLVLMTLLGRTARLCGQYARRYQHLTTQARLTIIWWAYTLFMVSGLLTLITLVLLAHQQDQFRPLLNQANQTVVIVGCIVLPLAAAPEGVLMALVRPVAWYQQRQQARLRRLHQAVIQIVPVVHFDDAAGQAARMPIEISDGRQLIWSHLPWTRTPTPQQEAAVLRALVAEQRVITEPGTHPLPPMPPDVARYNRAVAQVFDRLQQRAQASGR